MVIHHERFNLQGANITGISAEVPIEDQFAILKALLGNDKKIGVVYDPSNTGNVVLEAVSVAEKLGLKLIKTEVASAKKVVSAFKKIANTIDALWIIPDSTVITKKSLNNVLKRALKRKLPTFCTSNAIVNAGAVASISPDYTCIGLQAARIARKLLNNSMTIAPDISQPDKLKLSFNAQIADVVGVDITAIQSLQNKNEFYVRESDNSVEGSIEWCRLSSLTIFGPVEFE